jgi:CHAT domain-containing protein
MRFLARRFLFLAFASILLCSHPPPASAQSLDAAKFYYDQMLAAYNDARYTEALPFAQQLQAICEREISPISPNDPGLASLYFAIAHVYRVLDRTDVTMDLFGRALVIRERAFGPDHPLVGQVVIEMASTLSDHMRYSEAETMFQRAIAIAEKSRSPRDVAAALNDLSVTYNDQGRYLDAIRLGERALAELKRAVRSDDSEAAKQMVNLGAYYREAGRDAEAEAIFIHALAIQQKASQPSGRNIAADLDVSLTLSLLAALYRDRGQFADAEKLLLQALSLRQKWVGPDHSAILRDLVDLATLYRMQGRIGEAQAYYNRALGVGKKWFGPADPYVGQILNALTLLYVAQGRIADALVLVREGMAGGTATTEIALPALSSAKASGLITTSEAIDDSLNVVQRAKRSSIGEAVQALNARLVSGSGRLAELVRKDQDLAAEYKALDKKLVAFISAPPMQRDSSAEQTFRNRVVAIAQQRDQLSRVFAKEFPDYASLSRPSALAVKDVQDLLSDDEALIVISLDAKNYVWAISRERAEWKELAASSDEVGTQVSILRAQLDLDHQKPFDAQASFALWQKILAPVEDVFHAKRRLSFVLDGALTSLPPQLLVVSDPAGKELKQVDWLIRHFAVTVLPSVESLKVLRGQAAPMAPQKPLIGFADPVFNPDKPASGLVASLAASRGIQGTVADLGALKTALPQLPDTAEELRKIGVAVAATPADLFFGRDATETRVKQSALDQYRIVYFATHGLLAGDVQKYAKLNAEPALVLTLPRQPTALDDGLLTASEVVQLKLNAEWVVLSACNTAAGDKPGAEALSGLARAFFYAGGRSLLVSNWVVASDSTVALMTGAFAAAADPRLSHAEALQKAMLALIDDPQHVVWADPKYWAPFVVVGEPAKLN